MTPHDYAVYGYWAAVGVVLIVLYAFYYSYR